ncbi:hypothetical protein KSP39_PZI008921 [Platanthera zijinensis]|uniref:Serine aminopeptidase S33 domain-containing protein n=1 Tax=Platanthera zijinensis TaxID=2320716 RepID=A0AAP0G7E1_9ASPA
MLLADPIGQRIVDPNSGVELFADQTWKTINRSIRIPLGRIEFLFGFFLLYFFEPQRFVLYSHDYMLTCIPCWSSISLPLLILHGNADKLTDPSVSKALHEKAKSLDVKLHLYEDAFHSLLEGESDEMIFRVLGDVISWLEEHSTKGVNSLCS